ncbi:UNVERIFIED_CONTAM: hypothetical protein RMT77_016883 [Armadillidium vulgare]
MSKFVNKEHKKKVHSELWEEKQDVSSNIKSIKRNQEFYPRNPLFIILIYQLIYLSGIAYSIHNFFLLSQKWKNSLELSERKSIFGSRQDQNDLEWKIFIPILLECAPYAFLHLFLAQFIRCYCPQVLRPFYITFSTVMMWKILGLFGTTLCYLIPFVMFVVLYSRARYLVWVTWCSLLIAFNCQFFQDFLEKMMEDNGEREYTTSVIIAWIMLRCVSFCLITCDEDPERTKPDLPYLLDILSYSFYFPNFITGPYVPFKDYRAGVNEQFERWTLKKFVWFSLQIGKFLFYLFVADTLLYFFYAHSFQYNPRYIENLNSWTIAGYYSFILIFFFLKYVVMYGLPSVFARAEGIQTPDPPRCVFLVRRYSDIWRYFDIGLHRFIIDHIYIPFMGGDTNWLKEVQGTVVAFTFIYVWHGAYPAVLWWCVSNFFITVFEKAVDRFCQTSYYNDWEKKYLPGLLGKLFRVLASGVFLSISMNSLIIFLTSVEHATFVFKNIYIRGFPTTTLTTFLFFSMMAEGGNDFLGYRRSKEKPKLN